MKKKVYRVRTQYIFEGVFDLVAESKEEARQKVLQDCGLPMDGIIHNTLPDDEINWAFSAHPKVMTGQTTIQGLYDKIKRSEDLPTAPFVREPKLIKKGAKKHRRKAPRHF